jgi:YD repeat-containing protein
MVAIVSGNSLGLGSTSLSTLGRNGLLGTAGQGRSGEQAFVNVANGNLVLQDRDDYLVAHGVNLTALRTYNSQGKLNDDNADNWSMGAYAQQAKLTGTLNAAGSTITRTARDGSESVYSWDAARLAYVSTDGAGAYDTIKAVGGDYVWNDGDTGLTETYDAATGRLASTTDANGTSATYAYNASGFLASMTSASGDVTYFDYAGSNVSRVRSVRADGTTLTRVAYTYDGSNRLSTVTVDLSPDDNSTADNKTYRSTYTYDGSSKRVASVTQSDGTSLTFTYVQVGADYRVATVKDGLNHTTSYSYDTVNRRTTVTDPLGLVTSYEYDAAGQLTKITAPAVGGVSQVSSFAYNAAGDLVQVTDALGQALVMQYDANGNQLLQRDAAGNTVTRTYDARNQLLTESTYTVADPDGAGAGQPSVPLATRYVYDAGNKDLLRFVLSPTGRVTEFRYNAWGEQVASIQYGAAAYDVASLGATAVPGEAAMAAWAGSQNLALTSRSDSVLDARGQLQSVTSYARVDALGAGISDGSQSTTQYIYDQAGLLLKTISGTAGVNLYTYDGLGRVLSVQNALSQTTLTTYDDAGNRTTVSFANGLSTSSTYDAAGRLVSVTQSSAQTANLGTTLYFYDAGNRLTMAQDPSGVRAWMLYDEAGRKTADIDGNGSLTEYVYNKNNQVTQSIAYATAVNVATLATGASQPLNPPLAALRPAGVAADIKSWRVYDSAGRLLKTVDGQGAVTEMLYDGASRVLSVTHYANLISTAGLGAAPASGSVVPTANAAADRIERNFYDDDGLLLATLDAEGYLTVLRYDGAGRLAGRTAYAAATTPALRAAGTLAQLLPAAGAGDITTTLILNARGQVAGEIDAEGYLTEKVYDANGNLTQSARYATALGAGVLSSITAATTVADIRPAANPQDRGSSYSYDLLNRVVQSTDAAGTVTQFSYDVAGNLTQTIAAAGTAQARTLTAKYDLQGRLVGELAGVGSALLTGSLTQTQIDAVWTQYGLTHAYDAAGRRTSTTDGYGNKTLFFYDVDGHLTHTVNALGEVSQNQYNALGQLTATVSYGTRINLAGLTGANAGGLVNAALTAAVVANAALDSKTSYTYNSFGGLAGSTDALGNATALGYNAFGDEIFRAQDLGNSQTLVQTTTVDRRGLETGTALDAGGINAVTAAVYDAFGRLTGSTDANGHVSSRTFDRLGRAVTSVDPLNATRTSSYDAFDRVLTHTDGLGQVTSYSYDQAARSVTVTTPEGVQVTTVQTRFGQTQSVTDGLGNTTSFTYDLNGNLVTTATALTTTSNSYDRSNRLAGTTDANGNLVVLGYDAANRVLVRTVDPLGLNLSTSYSYDAKGRQATVTDPLGNVTQFSYDLKGQLTQQAVDPLGLNLVTAYSYDGRGKTLAVTDPRGTVTRYTYDKLGRRTLEQVDPTGLNLTRSYAWDKAGNATSSTDANGNLTRYAYDAGDRLVFTVDAAGNVRQNGFDAEGRIVKTTVYATAITPADLAALPTAASLAQIQARVFAAAGSDLVENRVYDRDGRLAATVNALGEVVSYTYDPAGNVIERVAYANRVAMSGAGAWVAGTAPAPVADAAHDQRVRTVYDQLGRAMLSIDGTGAVVRQVYDANGNVVDRLAYAGTISPATAATEAAINAAVLASGADSRVRNVYDKAGRLAYSADGTGAVTEFVYDKSGQVVQRIQHAVAIAAAAAPGSVSTNAADRITVFAYDKAGRQIYSVDALGGITQFVYDQNGNVAQRMSYATAMTPPTAAGAPSAQAIQSAVMADAANDRIERFAYDLADRKVFGIDGTGAVTETSFDAAGNAVQVKRYAALLNVATLGPVPTEAAVRALLVADAANDRTERRVFDAANRQVYGVDALGYVRKTSYDGTGAISNVVEYALAIPPATANTAAAVAAAVVASATYDRNNSFVYDAAGRLTGSTDALGFTESTSYNGLGEKLSFTNKKSATWTYDYDAGGRLIQETSPQVALTSVVVNAGGNLEVNEAASGAAGIVTRLAYDALGNLLSRTEAFGRAEQRITSYEYDALGRQVKTTYPAVGVYNPATDNLTSNGAAGLATRTETQQALFSQVSYDALGNAVANRDVAGNYSYKAYDKLGNVSYEVDSLGFVTGYTRNAMGEVTRLVRFGSATALANGNPPSLSAAQVDTAINAAGVNHGTDRNLLTQYDRAGRAVRITEPQTYVYDPDAASGGQYFIAGKTTRNTFDAFGNLTRVALLKNAATDSWTSTTNYFDKRGQQTAGVDALGYLTTQAFDAAGNLSAHTEFATAITGWNGASPAAAAPAAISNADDRTTLYVFDRGNRKTSEVKVNVEYSDSSNATSARGNLTTSYGYDSVGNLTRTTDAAGASTYSYYDAMGRVTAIAEPARAGADAGVLTPLTLFRRDAYGNVVVKTDLANGASAANESAYTAAATGAADRTAMAYFDRSGHVTQLTDAQGYNHYNSYDARGSIAKEWQAVTGNDGVTRTQFRAYQYDKLGQQTHVIDPASTTVLQGGLNSMQVSSATATADGAGALTLSGSNSVSLAWSSLINAGGGLVRVQIDYQTLSTYSSDVSGVLSHAASRVQDFGAGAASGGVTLGWANASATDGGISQLSYIRIWQQDAGGNWIAKWEGSAAQAVGSGVATVSQAQAGVLDTAVEYNAFGEMTRKGVNGGRQEYFDYDNAGHIWRTNKDDGVDKVALYDLQGHQTADIRSAGSGRANTNLLAFTSADQVAALTDVRRTDMRYDAIGHLTQQLQPERLQTQGGVLVRQNAAHAYVTSSSSNTQGWSGTNSVSLSWTSLASLGSGDVKVVMSYETQVYSYFVGTIIGTNEAGQPIYATDEAGNPIGTWVQAGGAAGSRSQILTAEQGASGFTMSWQDPAGTVNGGLGRVTHLTLYKKDLQGNWQQISDQSGLGYAGNSIEVAVPTDPGTDIQLQLRPAGTAGTGGWSNVGLTNFGDALRFDASALGTGNYEYRVLTTPPGGTTRTTATGTLSMAMPGLATIGVSLGFIQTGVYGWASPGAGVEQVLRVRPLGSTGPWEVRTVAARGGGYDGADLSNLGAGVYDYELLWTHAGEGAPYAHATGHIEVVAPYWQTQWITPANPANYITGYTDAQYSAPVMYQIVTGYNESGAPIYGTTLGANYQWSGHVVVGVPYPVWTLTSYTTVYYTVNVPTQGPPIFTGYDESGLPTYAHDEAGNLIYEIIYVPTTYSYQSPVYSNVWYLPPDPAQYMTAPSKPIYGPPVANQLLIGVDENGGNIYVTILAEHYQWSGNTIVAVPYSITSYIPTGYFASNTTPAGSSAISQSAGAQLGQTPVLNGDSQWVRPVVNQKTDRWGNVLEISDPRSTGWKTTYRYNASNQLVQQVQPDSNGNQGAGSPVTTIYYDRMGRQVALKDANGNYNGQVFDAAGNLVQEVHADGGVSSYRYDAFGNRIKSTDARGFVTTFNYDKLNRLLSTVRPAVGIYSVNSANSAYYIGTSAIVESSTWDQAGNKLTDTNGNGETLSYTYDLRHNVVATRQPLGQTVRASFDLQGRKSGEADANGYTSTWSYDYFGRLYSHTDLGGAKYSYTYDNARQLTSQTNTRGQSLGYTYDAAGQLTRNTDYALGKVTSYSWDFAGHQVREQMSQNGTVYQDNHMAYDALGRLRWVNDTHAFVNIDYDRMGNRTHIQTHVINGDTANDSNRYFQYDGMNRQTVVDAVDAAGNLGAQGHRITYDGSGNRTSDSYYGNRVNAVQVFDHYNTVSTGTPVWVVDESGNPVLDESGNPTPARDESGNIIYQTQQVPVYRTEYSAGQGLTTEAYAYDGLNRLTGVVRDGVQLDYRFYDGANRNMQTGPAGHLPVGYINALNGGASSASGTETRINRFDANGRLVHQRVFNSDDSAKYEIDYSSYDAAGNLQSYTLQNYQGTAYTNYYSYTQARYEGYKEARVDGSSTYFQPGATASYYDVNGNLSAIMDSTQPANNRSFISDAAGKALYTNQNGQVQRQLIVGGEVLGRYGNAASGANLADFNFGYQPINGNYPSSSPGIYIVGAGDTLQSIAKGAFGDSALWYRIAEANGLAGDNDLKVGQTLTIPNRVGTLSNNANTFKPYDPSAIVGDTTPNLPTPPPPPPQESGGGGGCGFFGQVLVIIIVVVATIYTAGALTSSAAGFSQTMAAGMSAMGTASATTLAVAGAVGSIAGQVAGNALGVQDGFSWEQVAMSAVGGALSSGLQGVNFTGAAEGAASLGNTITRAALGNALTQGAAVVTGLQDHFDWRGVAASAVGAGVGQAVGGAMGMNDKGFSQLSFGEQFGARLVTGLAAGTATAIARGGRIAVQQIATDAFGNALGGSLAEWSGQGYGANEGEQGATLSQVAQDNFRQSEINDQNWDARIQTVLSQSGAGQWDDAPLPSMADRYSQTYGGEKRDVADKANSSLRLPKGWKSVNGDLIAPDGTNMGSPNGAITVNIRDQEKFTSLTVNPATGLADFKYTSQKMWQEGGEALLQMAWTGSDATDNQSPYGVSADDVANLNGWLSDSGASGKKASTVSSMRWGYAGPNVMSNAEVVAMTGRLSSGPSNGNAAQQFWNAPENQGILRHSMVGTVINGAVSQIGDSVAGLNGYNPVTNQYYDPTEQQGAMWRLTAAVGSMVVPEAVVAASAKPAYIAGASLSLEDSLVLRGDASRAAIVQAIGDAAQPSIEAILKLDPNAQIGFRGSLASGLKGEHKLGSNLERVAFDGDVAYKVDSRTGAPIPYKGPQGYDADFFIVSEKLASEPIFAGERYRDVLDFDRSLKTTFSSMRTSMAQNPALSGMKVGNPEFIIRTPAETAKLLSKSDSQYYFLKR